MILEKLVRYYDSLLEKAPDDIAPLGYSRAKVSFAVVLSTDGVVQNLIDLRIESGNKTIPRSLTVPLQETRSS